MPIYPSIYLCIYVWVRTDLSRSLKVVEMHTWSSDWKRVVIVIVIIIYVSIYLCIYLTNCMFTFILSPSILTFLSTPSFCCAVH
jgi:hypothetical protein